MRFHGKTVLITGAASGIGAACAIAFAEEGADVVLAARNKERALTVISRMKQKGNGSYRYYDCDVSDYDSVKKLKTAVSEHYPGIDVLFNNAGIFRTDSLEDMDIEEWKRSFQTNTDGAMYMTKCFIGTLAKRKGCIINNASVSGLDSFTSGRKNYMYGASKAALIKFSRLCALNYAGSVRVNVICPGIIETGIYENQDFSRFKDSIPMGHTARPEDIAGVVKFLASEDAGYITGAVIPVDGGMSLK